MKIMTMNFPKSTWRLLITPPARGAWNMAVDEAILEAIGDGRVPATLRLYAWVPPCLSLGYAQPFQEVDLNALQEHGWDIVRRPTGGRAILHTDELTYSVTGPPDEARLSGSLLQSYHVLSDALLDALHRLGTQAQASPEAVVLPGISNQGPVCFEVPSNYEITVDGKKLVGSAQARRKEGVLQHGSLPLEGDLGRITQVLKFADEHARQSAADRIWQRATTVERALGRRVEWQEAALAFKEAFEGTLNLELLPGELTQNEIQAAERLVQDKYSHPAWIRHI
jgi:lipoyl(octanoyl) transferase